MHGTAELNVVFSTALGLNTIRASRPHSSGIWMGWGLQLRNQTDSMRVWGAGLCGRGSQVEMQECTRQIITGPDCTPPASLNRRIMESSELERISKGRLVPTPFHKHGHVQLDQAAQNSGSGRLSFTTCMLSVCGLLLCKHQALISLGHESAEPFTWSHQVHLVHIESWVD